jgi:hypothetical protein
MRTNHIKYATAIFLATTALFSCKNGTVEPKNPLNGSYSGQLYANEKIDAFNTGPITSNVSASFTESNYQDVAENVFVSNRLYPGSVDSGSYTISGNQVILSDRSVHTDDFDTNLTLGGTYGFVIKSDSLILTKTLPGGNTYIYKMKKN